MTTDDDRPGSTGGYSNTGLFSPAGGATQRTSRDVTGADEAFGGGKYDDKDDDSYASGATTVIARSDLDRDDPFESPPRTKPGWHSGADIGLLILRLTVAALFIGRGVQKIFGWMHGPGIDGTGKMLADLGFTHTTLLAWVNGLVDIAGGVFVGLGLFTPAGAGALLAIAVTAIAAKADTNLFAAGVELEVVYAAALFCVLFAGPGRVALDRHTPWYRNAAAYGLVFLVIAAGACIGVLFGLR